ncbi:PAS domain S-box protein [Bdellovibrio sp. SKB1291214]|uniref:PAS domain S-box protein n=1 Tax=Bdellovibrio sp. SKB1291214 TaxID=1732569 RepID=UPI000B51A1F9|nr:PAS domain S-box protein [Bdellovibrio sp. SKB1291214]UYL09104.1 PAS domain S-box protein [Bdellovibrio sp. SKB1291214]
MKQTESFLVNRVYAEQDLAVYLSDQAGNIHVWNRAAEALFGYSQKEIQNKSERDLFWDKSEDISDGGIRYSWRVTKNADLKFVKESVIEISDPSGPGDQFMKIIEDNSDGLTIWEQCELWISHYAHSPEGMYVVNAKTNKFQFINKAFASMMDEKPENILGSSGNNFNELGHHLGYFPKGNSQAKIAAEVDVNCLHDGAKKPKYFVGRLDRLPNKRTPLSEVEIPLLTASETPEEICRTWFKKYSAMHIGAIIVDAKKNILCINSYLANLLGYESEDLENRSSEEITNESDSSQLASSEAAWKNCTFTFKTKDGNDSKFSAISIYVRNIKKDIAYTVSLCRPIDSMTDHQS